MSPKESTHSLHVKGDLQLKTPCHLLTPNQCKLSHYRSLSCNEQQIAIGGETKTSPYCSIHQDIIWRGLCSFVPNSCFLDRLFHLQTPVQKQPNVSPDAPCVGCLLCHCSLCPLQLCLLMIVLEMPFRFRLPSVGLWQGEAWLVHLSTWAASRHPRQVEEGCFRNVLVLFCLCLSVFRSHNSCDACWLLSSHKYVCLRQILCCLTSPLCQWVRECACACSLCPQLQGTAHLPVRLMSTNSLLVCDNQQREQCF